MACSPTESPQNDRPFGIVLIQDRQLIQKPQRCSDLFFRFACCCTACQDSPSSCHLHPTISIKPLPQYWMGQIHNLEANIFALYCICCSSVPFNIWGMCLIDMVGWMCHDECEPCLHCLHLWRARQGWSAVWSLHATMVFQSLTWSSYNPDWEAMGSSTLPFLSLSLPLWVYTLSRCAPHLLYSLYSAYTWQLLNYISVLCYVCRSSTLYALQPCTVYTTCQLTMCVP